MIVQEAIGAHGPVHRNREEGGRDEVGEQGEIHHPAAAGDAQPRDRERRRGRDEQRQRTDGHRDHRGIPELNPEVPQEIVLLIKHDLEIVQGRVRRPQLAREGVFLGRDREQEHVIDRQHGPDEHGNADQ